MVVPGGAAVSYGRGTPVNIGSAKSGEEGGEAAETPAHHDAVDPRTRPGGAPPPFVQICTAQPPLLLES